MALCELDSATLQSYTFGTLHRGVLAAAVLLFGPDWLLVKKINR